MIASLLLPLALSAAAAPPAPIGVSTATARCAGAATALELLTTRRFPPRHDQDLGGTTLVLRARDGRELMRRGLSEIWECLGFDARTRSYVLAAKSEVGTRVLLNGLVYVDEEKPALRDSTFTASGFAAAAALLGPQARYLALIGAPSGAPDALYVLDLDRDVLRRLGPAPAPPPLSAGEEPSAWPWDAPDRWFTELEPGIWSFADASTLRVSAGKDTAKRRAKKRTVRTWKLGSPL
jgi:hypothetical protein